MADCLFCLIYHDNIGIIYENRYFYAQFDKYPITLGHAEIIPKRHIDSLFELETTELSDLLNALKETKKIIDGRHNPDAYNIGINDGVEAGRTIHHLHVHLIPRYKGDVENPKGGVRNVIPGKGDYTKT